MKEQRSAASLMGSQKITPSYGKQAITAKINN